MQKPYQIPAKRKFVPYLKTLKEIENDNTEMAINYQLFKIDLDTIPIFEGDEIQINNFNRTVENIIIKYSQFVEVSSTIRASIFSKFRGKAAEILYPRDDLITWEQIKNAILQHFEDSRSIEQLLIDFNNIRLEKNETLTIFGNRIRSQLAKLISKINLSNANNKELKIELYTANALDRFLICMPLNIQSQVRLRSPKNLDQAITLANDEVNFINRSKAVQQNGTYNNFYNSSPLQNPNFKPPQIRPNNNQFNFKNQQFAKSNQFTFRNPYQHFVSQNQFPFKNTSQQAYRPHNNFQRNPSNQIRQPHKQFFKPEPMSVQTTLNCEENTNCNQNFPNYESTENYQNFDFDENHQVNNEENFQNYYNPNDQFQNQVQDATEDSEETNEYVNFHQSHHWKPIT